jgi:hypothetical protein
MTRTKQANKKLAGAIPLLALAAAISAAGCSTGSASPAWTTFQDPMEQAFTVEIPKGWTVWGGLFRVGYSDVRPMVDVISPDGKIEVRLGDIAIPPYALPTSTHPPGDRVDLGAQAQMTSAKYHTGQEFVTSYAEDHFIRACQKIEPQPNQGDPPVVDKSGQTPGSEHSTSGQVTYKCSRPRGDRIAYAYARTNPAPNLWTVTLLASFLAPPESVPLARNVLEHATQTFQVTPQWTQKQQQEDQAGLEYQRARQQQRLAALGQQVQQFEQQMAAMRNQVSAFEAGQERQAKQVDEFDQALRGVTPTVDPYGNQQEVWTGPYANYYKNGLGVVVNSTDSPGAGWTQLKPTN